MTAILFFYNIGDHFNINTSEETIITTTTTTTATPPLPPLTESLLPPKRKSRRMFRTILNTFSTLNLKDRSWTDEAQSYLSTVIREMVIQILTDHIQEALDRQMDKHKDMSFDEIEVIKAVVREKGNYVGEKIELEHSSHGEDFGKSSLFGSRF